MRTNHGSADQIGIFLGKLLVDSPRRIGLGIFRGSTFGLLAVAKIIHRLLINQPPGPLNQSLFFCELGFEYRVNVTVQRYISAISVT
jgi:hypothetical protein